MFVGVGGCQRNDIMIVRCPSCGQKNRIPAERVDEQPRCGKCGDVIDAFVDPIKVDGDEFYALIEHAPMPLFVDFWAPWCGPCRMVAPEIEKLARRNAGSLIVAKLNTEDHPEVAGKEGVQGIPMFALYRDGERVATDMGYKTVAQIESRFEL